MLLGLVAAFLAACGAAPANPDAAEADAAWEALLAEPGTARYEQFLAANRRAAGRHADPGDARGITYQVRALEAQAGEAARTRDALLAHEVADRVRFLREAGHLDLYEETVPGARARLTAGESLVAPLQE